MNGIQRVDLVLVLLAVVLFVVGVITRSWATAVAWFLLPQETSSPSCNGASAQADIGLSLLVSDMVARRLRTGQERLRHETPMLGVGPRLWHC